MHEPCLACLQVLVDPAAGLLTQADLRGDILVSQAVQALLAASSGPVPAAGTEAVSAVATLLRSMQPSAKVLSALGAQLQAGLAGGSKLPLAARQALAACVRNHVPAAAGGGEPAGAEAVAGGGGAGGGAEKRKRGSSSAASSAVLQQQLLEMLAGGGGGRGGGRPAGVRPPRQGTSGTAGGT